MKRRLKSMLFLILETAFVAVIPLLIVYLGYGGWGEKAHKFKISFGVMAAFVVIFLIVKRVWLNPWLERQRIKAGTLEAQLETESDSVKIMYTEEALRRAKVIETIINWVLPLAFLGLAFWACRALEKSLVTFTGIIGFIGLSETIGFAVSVARAMCVESKHKPKSNDKRRNKRE